ncbi:hypothetical protein [Hydrogenophaga sp.]|uniref:hypothetical protein n=1 Tax=Hydrogenophaga sp. TaxID=1904254 RepID=UPI00261D95DB|nr:hypothetical protein [Hydrogenophaga sp.]MCW5653895.1 hypothetical protein [Hydrogenophaga sp.]
MADHSINALMAAARAMEQVVLPAVDKGHPLAMEQATLVTRFLKLFGQRWLHGHERNRFELGHYADLAEALQADAQQVSPAVAQAMAEAQLAARRSLDSADAATSELQARAQALAGVVTALVRTAQRVAHPARDRIERAVLEASAELLRMQRAWFLPQGWEPDPAAIPTLEGCFAERARRDG